MAARERRSETAVLRVLGFSQGSVLRVLLVEASAYGVLGAGFGVGLMALFSRAVGQALDKTQLAGMGALLVPDAGTVLFVVAAALLLAVGAGIVPAFNLSRRPIVQLLRETA